jgi:hypothetical protein
MNHVLNKFALRTLSALAFMLVAVGVQSASPSAAAGNQCPTQTSDAYSITLRALTGPGGGDLSVRIEPATPACVAPSALNKVQLKIFAVDGSLAGVRRSR